jgi:hypothetical protein
VEVMILIDGSAGKIRRMRCPDRVFGLKGDRDRFVRAGHDKKEIIFLTTVSAPSDDPRMYQYYFDPAGSDEPRLTKGRPDRARHRHDKKIRATSPGEISAWRESIRRRIGRRWNGGVSI